MLTSTEHISESYHNQCHELEGRIARCVQGCLEDLEVSDIMTTDVISVRPDDSVYSAMDLMVARSVSGLPVTGACCRLLRAVHARETSAPPSPPPAHAHSAPCCARLEASGRQFMVPVTSDRLL